ncbi:hypothetical protein EBZ38_02965 [bacterium]|nr:hypothetical protein [bacterium]
MASEIHVNDVGTRFLATIKDNGEIVNISNASILSMIFKKPSDNVFYRSGTLYTNGADGKVYYDTIAGDLDEPGLYKLQGRVSLPSGTYYTDIYSFEVSCNL